MEENTPPFCAVVSQPDLLPRYNATLSAHKHPNATATLVCLPPGGALPLDAHAHALLPLLVCAALCWAGLALRRSPTKQQQQQQEGAGGAWVRPLSNVPEVVSAVGALFGTFNMTNVLWLSSSQPLTPLHVRRALTQVAQQVEVLQMCVAWRRLWPWYRRMTHLQVDFGVEVGDPRAVCARQLRAAYNVSEGPLWRARQVPLPPQGPGHHRAALVISFHHVITDGTTNLLITKDLLHALNAAVTGGSASLPARRLAPPLTKDAAPSRHWLPSLAFVASATRAAFTTAFSSHSVLRHLPRPRPGKATTRFMSHEFSASATKQLLARCRAADTRVHSGVMAAAGLALHRTAQHFAGRRLDVLQVIHEQAVNMRRYSTQHREATGSMAFLTVQRHDVRDGADTFWPLARAIQGELERNLEVRRAPLRTSSLGWLCSAIIPINFVLARLGCTSFSYSHVCSSNMGDLRRLLGTEESGERGAAVRLSGLQRAMAGELAGGLCCLNCHTLHGRLTLSLDYYTNKMTEATATTFLTHLTHILTEVAARGAPQPCHTPTPTPRGHNGNG